VWTIHEHSSRPAEPGYCGQLGTPSFGDFRSSLSEGHGTAEMLNALFGDELAFAKYCQKEWPTENVDRVVASVVRNRWLN
jgi:hypothetical protein